MKRILTILIIAGLLKFSRKDEIVFKIGEENYQERKWCVADPSFFEIFNYQLLQGDPVSALSNPRSIVMSESAALQYFGSTDIYGETITLGDDQQATVTGVIKEPKGNTHLDFKILVSRYADNESWLEYERNWDAFSE